MTSSANAHAKNKTKQHTHTHTLPTTVCPKSLCRFGLDVSSFWFGQGRQWAPWFTLRAGAILCHNNSSNERVYHSDWTRLPSQRDVHDLLPYLLPTSAALICCAHSKKQRPDALEGSMLVVNCFQDAPCHPHLMRAVRFRHMLLIISFRFDHPQDPQTHQTHRASHFKSGSAIRIKPSKAIDPHLAWTPPRAFPCVDASADTPRYILYIYIY